MRQDSWILPDGVDELLPPQAAAFESLRRRCLDLFRSWGYQLVVPPLIEFMGSLQANSGDDLDVQTFKLTDQISGRLMGLRADITPQAARIDAHRMPTDLPQRLGYVGPVLHTVPEKFAGSRNPLQLGAELYGHAGIESDAEVIGLLIETLDLAQLNAVTIELGHMGVFKTLVKEAALPPREKSQLLDALLRKSEPEVRSCLNEYLVDESLSAMFTALLDFNGGPEIVKTALQQMADASPQVRAALADLERLVGLIGERYPAVNLHIDLAELRGYEYHTGVIFAAYTPESGRSIAWGGRYDNIGERFGRARPATGFSLDLKYVVGLTDTVEEPKNRIFAPADADPALWKCIAKYRSEGRIVISCLPGQIGDAEAFDCDQTLHKVGGEWQLKST